MSGTRDNIRGKTKEVIGDITDDEDLKREGQLDQASGTVKDKAGEAKDWTGDKVDDLKDKLGGHQ